MNLTPISVDWFSKLFQNLWSSKLALRLIRWHIFYNALIRRILILTNKYLRVIKRNLWMNLSILYYKVCILNCWCLPMNGTIEVFSFWQYLISVFIAMKLWLWSIYEIEMFAVIILYLLLFFGFWFFNWLFIL